MSILETEGRKRGAYFTADELMSTHFPEPRWAVPGLLPEGLSILGGAPKIGKSWLCLGMGIDIANGDPVLGKIPTDAGSVLYAALEDPARRLQSRLRMILADRPAPSNLTLVTELPPGMDVAIDCIAEWLEAHDDARLVVIDVLAKFRPPASATSSAYSDDYGVLSKLKKLADDYRVALVLVTHLRKMHADDAFDQISGSTGLTGAADTSLVIQRNRNENGASLHVTGRDVLENEYACSFDPTTCTWSLDGTELAEAAQKAHTLKASEGLGDKSADIIELLAQHPEGLGPTAVGGYMEMTAAHAGTYLRRLESNGRVRKLSRGQYTLVQSVQSVQTDGSTKVAHLHSMHTLHTPTGGDDE